MTEAQRLPYRVSGRHMNDSRISLCATPAAALQRLNAYRNARYRNIEVVGPDGVLSRADLHRLIIETAERLVAAVEVDQADMGLQLIP